MGLAGYPESKAGTQEVPQGAGRPPWARVPGATCSAPCSWLRGHYQPWPPPGCPGGNAENHWGWRDREGLHPGKTPDVKCWGAFSSVLCVWNLQENGVPLEHPGRRGQRGPKVTEGQRAKSPGQGPGTVYREMRQTDRGRASVSETEDEQREVGAQMEGGRDRRDRGTRPHFPFPWCLGHSPPQVLGPGTGCRASSPECPPLQGVPAQSHLCEPTTERGGGSRGLRALPTRPRESTAVGWFPDPTVGRCPTNPDVLASGPCCPVFSRRPRGDRWAWRER